MIGPGGCRDLMNRDSVELLFDRGRGKSAEAREVLLAELASGETAQVRSLWASDDHPASFLHIGLVAGVIGAAAQYGLEPRSPAHAGAAG